MKFTSGSHFLKQVPGEDSRVRLRRAETAFKIIQLSGYSRKDLFDHRVDKKWGALVRFPEDKKSSQKTYCFSTTHSIFCKLIIYFPAAISSIMAVVSDLGLSIGYPKARSQTMFANTPIERPIPNNTV